MESVVFQESPLAHYLEGEGRGASDKGDGDSAAGSEPESFAPSRSVPKARIQQSRETSHGNVSPADHQELLEHAKTLIMGAVRSHLSGPKNEQFLEHFRYQIVASQLLSQHVALRTHSQHTSPPPSPQNYSDEQLTAVNASGLSITAIAAFILAYVLQLLYTGRWMHMGFQTSIFLVLSFGVCGVITYSFSRRQRLRMLRASVLEIVDGWVNTMQSFDSEVSAAMLLIQEVELVYRGYHASYSMPPTSRIEDVTKSQRSVQLRRSLVAAIDPLYGAYYNAYKSLRPLTVESDREKFHDIYEISAVDVEDARLLSTARLMERDHRLTLRELKLDVDQLHFVRKLLLSTMLAIHADGSPEDYARWKLVRKTVTELDSVTGTCMRRLNEISQEEEDIRPPSSPKIPTISTNEASRSQLRRISTLSQGFRGLQAKLRLLREETDAMLENNGETSTARERLLIQYNSIGADLRDLNDEWEHGKAALIAISDRSGSSRPVSLNALSAPLSPTVSLGGDTAVGESPQDAFRALHGKSKSVTDASRSSVASESSDEQIFEAMSLQRPRSTLTREQRIAKMKDDRRQQISARDSAMANARMLEELETVIKLRPQGHMNGRITSV